MIYTLTSFFVHFSLIVISSSIGILQVLLLKKGLKKHISAKWQYRIDLLFFVLLATPFIPSRFFASLNIRTWLNTLHFERQSTINMTTYESSLATYGTGWLQVFAVDRFVPIDRFAPDYLLVAFLVIWIAGIFIFAIAMFLCNKELRLIIESMKPVEDAKILSLFSYCKSEVGVKSNIPLGSSILLKTPMTVGFFKTRIILPMMIIKLEDIRYALLHELVHCKNKDILINNIICLFQILYWFNPLVHLAFKQMKLDRELACDASVLDMLPKEQHIQYGGTLLNFANSISYPLYFTAPIGGSKPQIVKRIEHIVTYTTELNLSKTREVYISILIGFLIFCQIPLFSSLANINDNRFHFQANNVIYQDLSAFFDGIDGSFVLYDLNYDQYTIHNRNMSVTRVSPNSTYKIVSTLIALETGVLETNCNLKEWDGIIHPFETWNKDHDLVSAMQYSVNWYFQELDIQVGIQRLHSFLTLVSYGNHNIYGGITDFWIESSLRISPLEQVRFLRDLHQNNTIFETEHINILKNALRLSEQDDAVLSGKTGTGMLNGKVVNGWFIGYVEKNGSVFIFATYIHGEDSSGSITAVQITLSILEYKGIFYPA